MKYYLDEDISPTVAELLRKDGIDAVGTHEVGRVQSSDKDQLSYAASQGRVLATRNQGRVLATRNRNDFIRLTIMFFNDLLPHEGVVIVPYSFRGDDFVSMAEALKKYACEHSKGMEPYTIDFPQKEK